MTEIELEERIRTSLPTTFSQLCADMSADQHNLLAPRIDVALRRMRLRGEIYFKGAGLITAWGGGSSDAASD